MNMNLESLLNHVQTLAHAASTLIPAAGLAEKGAEIGKKIIGIIDDLHEHVPADRQGPLQATRTQLATAIGEKADRTSARLRGK